MKATLLNNRYRILETLGRGGFGETYLTEDTHMPSGRKCVLKQLKPIVKEPKTPLWMKERFQREAAILEQLGEASPQIPRLYAYFSENEKFYLVQEWIEGLTLDKYWEREGNLHRDEVRNILVQILPVLDLVHSRHIIHRDIKPENIILRQRDGAPVLIDFGAVKEAMATTMNQSSSSMYSASIGTPGFMPSEQAAGRPLYSSDLYSLGLTAIFLLTGRSPHELDTDIDSGEIIWREHAANVDPELMDVLDRAIKFHPRDRFTTATEMLAALENKAQTSNGTGATVRVAPKNSNVSHGNTAAVDVPYPQTKAGKKRGLLANALLFILISMGVGAGTFVAGLAILSSIWRSPEPQEAAVEPTQRQPAIFSPAPEEDIPQTTPQENPQKPQADAQTDKPKPEADKPEIKLTKQPKPETNRESSERPDREPAIATNSQPQSQPQPEVESPPEITIEPTDSEIPIVTTGTSETQLVDTLGKPTSERPGWEANSRVLVYNNLNNGVQLSYQSDGGGTIRQTDIAIERSVSLGSMQDSLAQLLGGNAPAEVKDKLRSVYLRQTNLSSFQVGNLEGMIRSDSKDRINISIKEASF
jgi:serine/threonine protein kinase, bacterial